MEHKEIQGLTPADFENLVANILQKLGFETKQISLAEDIGIDILATNKNESIAVQVKKYCRRKINLAMIYHTYGASKYYDCSRAVIVTLGSVTPRAIEASRKLQVEIWGKEDLYSLAKDILINKVIRKEDLSSDSKEWFFNIWNTYIKNLQGREINHLSKNTHILVSRVDDDGIIYINSNGRTRDIGVEVIHSVLSKLRTKGLITREDINADYQRRGSSAISAIIASIPYVNIDGKARVTTLVWNEINR